MFLMALEQAPGANPLGDLTYLTGGPEGQVMFAFVRSPMAQGYAYPNNPFRDDTWDLVVGEPRRREP